METKRIADHRSYRISDQEVVQRIIDGEKELYEVLLRRYNQTLYRVIRSYLKNEADIEDIMQLTYIKAWERLSQFRGDAAFSTWLVRIGIHEALMHLRKQKNNKVLPLGQNLNKSDGRVGNMNPEKNMAQREARHLLERAIDQLPEKYRTVYMLREIEGLDNHETAECLQISDSNVKVRLHRARTLLKESLLKMADQTDLFEFGFARCDSVVERVMSRI